MKKDAKRSVSDLEFILLALLEQPMAGRCIARRYEEKMAQPIPFGSLYTTLTRLQYLGFLQKTGFLRDCREKSFKRTRTGTMVVRASKQYYRFLAEL